MSEAGRSGQTAVGRNIDLDDLDTEVIMSPL